MLTWKVNTNAAKHNSSLRYSVRQTPSLYFVFDFPTVKLIRIKTAMASIGSDPTKSIVFDRLLPK